jgi:hypothetical protein
MGISRDNRFGTFGTPVLIHPQIFKQPVQREPSHAPLADVAPEAPGIPYATWKADQLNRIFAEHGTAGPGRIKPETIMDSLEKYLRRTT